MDFCLKFELHILRRFLNFSILKAADFVFSRNYSTYITYLSFDFGWKRFISCGFFHKFQKKIL